MPDQFVRPSEQQMRLEHHRATQGTAVVPLEGFEGAPIALHLLGPEHRDRKVEAVALVLGNRCGGKGFQHGFLPDPVRDLAVSRLHNRSTSTEERRVGKEWVRTCRTRWAPE